MSKSVMEDKRQKEKDLLTNTMSTELRLQLNSPVGADPVIFDWPLTTNNGKKEGHDGAMEIVETIRWVCEDYAEVKAAMELNNMLMTYEPNNYESMRNLCERYNRSVGQLHENDKLKRLGRRACRGLVKHVISQVYNVAVTDPEKLNVYPPFSPEVYGETSFELIAQMIEQLQISPDDLFIDLGSGVGQVVLQMAALTECKFCFGVEKAKLPSSYAKEMDRLFRMWMKWHGKKYGDFELVMGDFLSDDMRERITQSTFVFVNNFAFGPKVDHDLKERFADLKDGARIVSSKSFCQTNFRITERTLTDIGTIMHVSEFLKPMKGSVSWTNRPVTYYLHIIDRSKLEEYFACAKNGVRYDQTPVRGRGRPSITNGNGKADRLKPIDSRSNTSNDSNSDQRHVDDVEGDSDGNGGVIGPTTRRAWSDWCSSRGKSSKENSEDDTYGRTNNNGNHARNPRSQSTGAKKGKGKKKILRKKIARNKIPMDHRRGPEPVPVHDVETISMPPLHLGAPPVQTTARGGAVLPARKTKGRRTKKRPLKINGLDLLHNQTLLSTSAQEGKKLPPAQGCVDQKLTQLTTATATGIIQHEELTIPSRDTPYALQKLLDIFRNQMLDAIEQMKTPEYRQIILEQIEIEKSRQHFLKRQRESLAHGIERLLKDSTVMLRAKLEELGIPGELATADTLLSEARTIVVRHKDLQSTVTKLSNEVSELEATKEELEKARKLEILDHCLNSGMINGNNLNDPTTIDTICRDFIMFQLSLVLKQRKDLERTIAELNAQIISEQKEIDDKSHQQQKQSRSLPVTPVQSDRNGQEAVHKVSPKTNLKREKGLQRTRSQEWPDIPDIGKINENNPELLAKKILESGRKLEACKLPKKSNQTPASNAAPVQSSPLQPCNQQMSQPGGRKTWNSKCAGEILIRKDEINQLPKPIASFVSSLPLSSSSTPKVSFYEDGVKSIITNLLNEDSGSQNQNTGVSPAPAYYTSPGQSRQKSLSPRAKTPPRSNENDKRKKSVPISPDISNGAYLHGKAKESAGKLALRARFLNQEKDKQVVPDCGSSAHRSPRTIQDLVSGEIEKSLLSTNASTSHSKYDSGPINFISSPVRGLYSPISRPNSNENILEGLSAGQSHGYPERASVLVTAKPSHQSLPSQRQKTPLEKEMVVEGLAAGLQASLIATPHSKSHEWNTKARENVIPENDTHSKVTSTKDPTTDYIMTTEVVLGSVADVDMDNNGKSSDSILRVVRKRMSDPNTGTSVGIPQKKMSMSPLSTPLEISIVTPGSMSKSAPSPATPRGRDDHLDGTKDSSPDRYASSSLRTPPMPRLKHFALDDGKFSDDEDRVGPDSHSQARVTESPTQKWQNSVSSNFEKLFSFASEFDRKRKESSRGNSPRGGSGNNMPASPLVSTTTLSIGRCLNVISERPKTPTTSLECTTSPDSGIGKDLSSSSDVWIQTTSNQANSEVTSFNCDDIAEKIQSSKTTLSATGTRQQAKTPRFSTASLSCDLDELDLDLAPPPIKLEVMDMVTTDRVFTNGPEPVRIKEEQLEDVESNECPMEVTLESTRDTDSQAQNHLNCIAAETFGHAIVEVPNSNPQQQNTISSSNIAHVEQHPAKYFKKRWHMREESSILQTDGGRSSVASDCSSIASTTVLQDQQQSLSSSPAPAEGSKFRPKGKTWDWNGHTSEGIQGHGSVQAQLFHTAINPVEESSPQVNTQTTICQLPPNPTPIFATSNPALERRLTGGPVSHGAYVPPHPPQLGRVQGQGHSSNGPLPIPPIQNANQHGQHQSQHYQSTPGNYYAYTNGIKGVQQQYHVQHSAQQGYQHHGGIPPQHHQYRPQQISSGRYPQMQNPKIVHAGAYGNGGYNGNMDYSEHSVGGYHQSPRRHSDFGYYSGQGNTAYSNCSMPPQQRSHGLHPQNQHHAVHGAHVQNSNLYHHNNPNQIPPPRR